MLSCFKVFHYKYVCAARVCHGPSATCMIPMPERLSTFYTLHVFKDHASRTIMRAHTELERFININLLRLVPLLKGAIISIP